MICTMPRRLSTHGAIHPLLSGSSPTKSSVQPEQYHRALPEKEEDVMVLQYITYVIRRLLVNSPSDSGQSLTASLPNFASHVMSRPSVLTQIPFVSHASDVVVAVIVGVVAAVVVVIVVFVEVVVVVVVVVVVEVCRRAELCFPVQM